MLFMGTVMVNGKGKMVVTATGSAKELGKIAGFLREEKEEPTPLQEQFESIGKRLFLRITLQ